MASTRASAATSKLERGWGPDARRPLDAARFRTAELEPTGSLEAFWAARRASASNASRLLGSGACSALPATVNAELGDPDSCPDTSPFVGKASVSGPALSAFVSALSWDGVSLVTRLIVTRLEVG